MGKRNRRSGDQPRNLRSRDPTISRESKDSSVAVVDAFIRQVHHQHIQRRRQQQQFPPPPTPVSPQVYQLSPTPTPTPGPSSAAVLPASTAEAPVNQEAIPQDVFDFIYNSEDVEVGRSEGEQEGREKRAEGEPREMTVATYSPVSPAYSPTSVHDTEEEEEGGEVPEGDVPELEQLKVEEEGDSEEAESFGVVYGSGDHSRINIIFTQNRSFQKVLRSLINLIVEEKNE